MASPGDRGKDVLVGFPQWVLENLRSLCLHRGNFQSVCTCPTAHRGLQEPGSRVVAMSTMDLRKVSQP